MRTHLILVIPFVAVALSFQSLEQIVVGERNTANDGKLFLFFPSNKQQPIFLV
jgi:hypothetical protein